MAYPHEALLAKEEEPHSTSHKDGRIHPLIVRKTFHPQTPRIDPKTVSHYTPMGVGIPGACEAMGHWRSTVEGLIIDGKLPALVAADIDLVNMFGNCEWPSIRAAIDDELREVKAWTDWHHAAEAITILPCGDEFTNNRGAEQGDGFGSLQACSVLAHHRHHWTPGADDTEATTRPTGADSSDPTTNIPFACDEWYVDDGQVFVRPNDFEPWLKALDTALARFGASRGTIEQGNAKSSARLLCLPDERDNHSGWDTPYVRNTVEILDAESTTSALGAPTEGPHAIAKTTNASSDKDRGTRAALQLIDQTPTETVQQRPQRGRSAHTTGNDRHGRRQTLCHAPPQPL